MGGQVLQLTPRSTPSSVQSVAQWRSCQVKRRSRLISLLSLPCQSRHQNEDLHLEQAQLQLLPRSQHLPSLLAPKMGFTLYFKIILSLQLLPLFQVGYLRYTFNCMPFTKFGPSFWPLGLPWEVAHLPSMQRTGSSRKGGTQVIWTKWIVAKSCILSLLNTYKKPPCIYIRL